MSQNEDSQKGEGTNQNDIAQPNKPKKLRKLGGKIDPNRSKSAPIEVEDNGENEEGNNDYIASYNYYLYYNSIKPVDPRLPKPTYTPKPNLEFIRESKPKDEEDEENPENLNLNTPIENVTNDLEKLNLDVNPKNNKNQNESNNKDVDFEQFKIKFSSPNPNQKETNKDAPSPFVDYYANLDQQNDNHQWSGDSLNPGNMYQYQMSMPNMIPPNMKVPMNPLYQMNPNINLYPNLSPYGNMPPQIPMMNNRMNMINTNGQNINNKKNQKKGQMNNNMIDYQNQMSNNLYDQRLGQYYTQPNPMMNMGLGMNYPPNDPNLRYVPQIAGYNKGGLIQNEAKIPLTLNIPVNIPINYGFNGMEQYQQINNMNMNNMNSNMFPNQQMQNNNLQNKKKSGKENSKKDIENKNIDDIIEKAVEYSKDHSGSRQVQNKYSEGPEEVRNKIFEKLRPEILNLSKDIFGNYVIQKVLEYKDSEKNEIIFEAIKGNISELSLNMYGCRVMQQLINVKCY